MKKSRIFVYLLLCLSFSFLLPGILAGAEETGAKEGFDLEGGLGFKLSPKESANLVLLRLWFMNNIRFGFEGGLSFWNDGTNSNLHLEILGLYTLKDYGKARVNTFAGIQSTIRANQEVIMWLRGGLELEFFLLDKISLLAEGSLNMNLTNLPQMDNTGGSVATGFIIYK